MVDVSLQNVTVDGDWIEGDIDVKVNAFLEKKQHFKTMKNVSQTYDLGGGVKLSVTGLLEPPNNACVTGKISTPLGDFDLPKKCVAVN